ncbi:heparinase II/III family protein [Pleionea sp. CnH1-48]|uniref:heparinase II/III domain-containing protein n=1 Tax=Pleionea sp. CnH1-48 TaxID=2954494 RepID=UPI002097890C|nr:heparinase II/III family protein [Pleionea sp. CnH1-48]MCO7223788.1 heparinase II/III family protein [Pleionea sp. CnH1-48]
MKLQKIKTLVKLGIPNLLRVVLYRSALKFGGAKALFKSREPIAGSFFTKQTLPIIEALDYKDSFSAFGWHEVSLNEIPDWHASVLDGGKHNAGLTHWSDIPDFGLAGDIKLYWELSRFDWVIHHALNYLSGDEASFNKLNQWLSDWSEKNPCNLGVNWKCGQEASIRVIHLTLAALLLKQELSDSFVKLLTQHLERISPSMMYAVAQDNNHGTSEAAALFVGGCFLRGKDSRAQKWLNKGRYWLENRTNRLILEDGSFSQYSTNYHRLMLDTLSYCEYIRRHFGQPDFSSSFYKKARKATSWLFDLVEPISGDVPNLGANDGARLIPLSSAPYRDYRPTVQLAANLFYGALAFEGEGDYNLPIMLLSLPSCRERLDLSHEKLSKEGGFALLRHGNSKVFFRFPRFRFRPSQCDAMHVDLWVNEKNILRDGGSYSYNAGEQWLEYFQGVASHNTAQFDDREQMPKISRFLFGEWLTAISKDEIHSEKDGSSYSACYTDYLGGRHCRQVTLKDAVLEVKDQPSGFKDKVVFRWRLLPGKYSIQGNHVIGEQVVINVDSDEPVLLRIVDGWESRFYYQKKQLPVLEVELQKQSSVLTTIQW